MNDGDENGHPIGRVDMDAPPTEADLALMLTRWPYVHPELERPPHELDMVAAIHRLVREVRRLRARAAAAELCQCDMAGDGPGLHGLYDGDDPDASCVRCFGKRPPTAEVPPGD